MSRIRPLALPFAGLAVALCVAVAGAAATIEGNAALMQATGAFYGVGADARGS